MAHQIPADGNNLSSNLWDKSPVGLNGGRLRVIMDSLEVTTAELAVGTLGLFRVPSAARVAAFYFGWDDLGTTVTADMGLLKEDGTAVDVDYFASALALGTTQDWQTTDETLNILFKSGVNTDANYGSPIYEILGLTASTALSAYVVGLNVTASSTPAAGTLTYRFEYVVD